MRKVCLLTLLFPLAWIGCRNEPITWRAPLHDVLFLRDTLAWSNLVPDSLWMEGDDGVALRATARRSLLGTESWLPRLDTAWTTEFTLPFIGGPIPVAPGAEIWSEVETINLGLPGVGLRRARLAGGVLSLSVSSTVQGPLELRYSLDGAQFPAGTNGGSHVVSIVLEPGMPASVLVALEGVELDLDGPDGLMENRLETSWEVRVPDGAQEPVGLFGDDALVLEVGLLDLEVAQVEGRFETRTLALADTLDVGELGPVQSIEVAWSDISLQLDFHNTAGVDLGLKVDAVARADAEGVVTELEDAVLGSAVFLPRAVVAEPSGMGDWQIETTQAAMAFGAEAGGNLPGFLSAIPQYFSFAGGAELNPLGDVSGGYDRIDLSRPPTVDWTLVAPLAVGHSRMVWLDTLDPALPDGIDFEGELKLYVESSLPIGAMLSLEVVEVPQHLLLVSEPLGVDRFVLAPLVVEPGSGSAANPMTEAVSLSLHRWHWDALRMGARLRVELVLETPDSGAQFDVNQAVVLRGVLDGDAIISIE